MLRSSFTVSSSSEIRPSASVTWMTDYIAQILPDEGDLPLDPLDLRLKGSRKACMALRMSALPTPSGVVVIMPVPSRPPDGGDTANLSIFVWEGGGLFLSIPMMRKKKGQRGTAGPKDQQGKSGEASFTPNKHGTRGLSCVTRAPQPKVCR